ncbi:4-hydroxy-tetrahydrodipicolinate reductase [Luminiphilus sp.]|nr:4-hydroxy-tetrahydrodipicolinate reductase [Luminiphilus sp.]MDA9710955.1 4-hydroxy-tetrahydrodipicolinate reductase [Luminiphilus sp.]
MTVRVGITGAAGRMGRMLAEVITQPEMSCELAAAIERPGSSLLGADMGELIGGDASGVVVTSDLASAADKIDVLIDFTVPEATLSQAAICGTNALPMVIGTTGFTDAQAAELAQSTASVAVCQSSNFAPGVNLTFKLAEAAALALGDSVDVEIVEAHHRHKIDAPSGTALSLGEAVAEALGRDLEETAIYGREGRTGARGRDTIGFSTIRAGDIVGDHTVIFAGEGERIEITHRASSRMAFAQGAVLAACWVLQQTPGRYSMQDVLADCSKTSHQDYAS